MIEQAGFLLRGRNPDVLSCIANLSNDEVFTPPEFANRMLDTLAEAWAAGNDGADIWADSSVRFLDPFTKSGVFLREITKRLKEGLEDEIPDLQERIDHILTKQVFGIGITQLTALLARRSLYCSKHATGEHSIAKGFSNDDGNIWYERAEHTWVNDKCKYCGASKETLDRSEEAETHAYAFIHTDDIKARVAGMFGDDMQFDVIIGNPPYQLTDASKSASATPIYHRFIQQAQSLEPAYLVMVTPSRWFVGGKGLDEFRKSMLSDRRITNIVDYIVERDAFPSVNLNGGVSYFLWSRDHEGDCSIITVERGGVESSPVSRSLDEFDVFIRRNEAVSILRKVQSRGESTFDKNVSARKPFGLPTNFYGAASESSKNPIKLHSSGKVTWVARSKIPARQEWVDCWKVLIGRATDGNENYPLPVWDKKGPFVAGPGEACTETYLVASICENKKAALSTAAYMRTAFFRFLISLRKITQDNKADVFSFVPDISGKDHWTDDQLYERYGINKEEVEFINAMIRDMKFTG